MRLLLPLSLLLPLPLFLFLQIPLLMRVAVVMVVHCLVFAVVALPTVPPLIDGSKLHDHCGWRGDAVTPSSSNEGCPSSPPPCASTDATRNAAGGAPPPRSCGAANDGNERVRGGCPHHRSCKRWGCGGGGWGSPRPPLHCPLDCLAPQRGNERRLSCLPLFPPLHETSTGDPQCEVGPEEEGPGDVQLKAGLHWGTRKGGGRDEREVRG